MGRPKAVLLGHCIKSCLFDTVREWEEPSVGAESFGNLLPSMPTYVKPDMYKIYKRKFTP